MTRLVKKKTKQFRWWWLLLVIVLLIGLGFVGYYLRISYVPEIETPSDSVAAKTEQIDSLITEIKDESADTQSPEAKKTPQRLTKNELSKIIEKLDDGDNTPEGLKINETTATALLLSTIYRQLPPENGDYLKQLRTSISPEYIQIESIVEIEKIPWHQLPKEIRMMKSFAMQMLPRNQKAVYLNIKAKPIVEDRILKLDRRATLSIGKVTYQISDLFSLPMISRISDGKIKITDFPYQKLELREGEMILLR
jgi:hypothetical protein